MERINSLRITILTILLVFFCGTVFAQNKRERAGNIGCNSTSTLSGVYRIDVNSSDKLYSVIEGATSNVPHSEQQQFFMDLAVRLTPPDLLAIECRGSRVSLGSSRAPRVDFVADGVTRNARNAGGRAVRSRIGFERDNLIFASSGGNDNLNFIFTPIENGKRLRVTRRISSQELVEPVIIQTIYNKIADVVRWDIYVEGQINEQLAKQDNQKTAPVAVTRRHPVINENGEANSIRESLNQWIDATNARDIKKEMSFYMPVLKAFYLARNTSRNSVRIEKTRAFANADSIDIRAAEPEIIFQDSGRTAIMRFRKKYNIGSRTGNRSGEVVQELRWQQTSGGWKIFSERDIKVIS